MIARIWKGVVRRADADTYADYIRETGFAEYADTPGNRSAWMLRRDEDERYLVGGESTVTHYEIADEVRPRSGR